MGTFEGYVPGNTDFYYRGQNVLNFSNASISDYTVVRFETTYIYVAITTSAANTAFIRAGKSFNFASFSNIYMELNVVSSSGSSVCEITLNRNTINYTDRIGKVGINPFTTGARTLTFNITNYRTTFAPVFGFELHGGAVNVNRIRVA